MRNYTSRGWIGWGLAFAVTLGIVGLILLPPYVGETARGLIMQAFAGVCHQLPDRSPHIGGVALAVCDRCMGIYGGLVLGVLGFAATSRWQEVIHRYAGHILLAALVPLAVDWVGPVLGLWANAPLSRVVTGGLFGVVAGYVLAHLAVRAARRTVDPQEETSDAEVSSRAPTG